MKTIVLLIAVFFTLTSFAQTHPLNNGTESFENWETLEGGDLPEQWDGFNREIVMSGFPVGVVTTVTKDSLTPYSGNYAAKLTSQSVLGGPAVPGILTTGNLIIDFNAQTGDIVGGVPFGQRPSSFQGYFKHYPNPYDTAIISVTFKRQGVEIGGGSLYLTDSVDTWTNFHVPIQFTTSQTPDTMIVFISTSTRRANVPMGSVLFVDELSFDYSTGIENSDSEEQVKVYPNPSRGLVTVNAPLKEACSLFLFDMSGNLVFEDYGYFAGRQLNLQGLSDGVYFLKVQGSQRSYSQKIVLQ